MHALMQHKTRCRPSAARPRLETTAGLRRTLKAVGPLIVAILVASAGCDGDGASTDAGPGADAGLGDAGPTETFSFYVEDPAGDRGVEGASVHLDAPSGERFEGTTGADGIASFDFVWADDESISVTVVADGWVLRSLVQWDRAAYERFANDGALTVEMLAEPADPPALVTLSGAVLNQQDDAHFVAVQALPAYGPGSNMRAAYSVEVPAGEDLEVSMVEFELLRTGPREYTQPVYRAGTASIDAITEDTTIDLDISETPVALQTGTATLTMPDAAFPLDGPAFLQVSSDQGVTAGVATSFGPSAAANEVAVELTWAERPMVELTTIVSIQNGDRWSVAYFDGVPSSRAELTWLAPPETLQPAFGVAQSLYAPLAFADPGDGVSVSLRILADESENPDIVWIATGGPGVASLELPQLPAAASRIGSSPLNAVPTLCALRAGEDGAPTCVGRSQGTRIFDLTP